MVEHSLLLNLQTKLILKHHRHNDIITIIIVINTEELSSVSVTYSAKMNSTAAEK